MVRACACCLRVEWYSQQTTLHALPHRFRSTTCQSPAVVPNTRAPQVISLLRNSQGWWRLPYEPNFSPDGSPKDTRSPQKQPSSVRDQEPKQNTVYMFVSESQTAGGCNRNMVTKQGDFSLTWQREVDCAVCAPPAHLWLPCRVGR